MILLGLLIEFLIEPNVLYFYDYNFDSDSIKLNLFYCENIQFDKYGEILHMELSEVFERCG